MLTKNTLETIIAGNPFAKYPEKDPAFMHVTFLISTPGNFDIREIEAKKQDGEEFFSPKRPSICIAQKDMEVPN